METVTKSIYKDKFLWFMVVIEMVMTFIFSVTLSMTSPLITNIVEQTGWTLGQAGQLNSIVFLLMGVFAFVGSPLMDRFGTKKTALIALGLAAAGCIMALFCGDNFVLHYLGKFIYGCGWGVFFVVPGAVISYWIPQESRSIFQGIRSSCDLFGYGVSYYIVLPIFHALNENWQATFFAFGLVFAVIFVAYLFLIKVNDAELEDLARLKAAREAKKKAKEQGERLAGPTPGIVQAARSKWVWILVIGQCGKIWPYNVFSTYLPSFFELERGMSAETASAYTGAMAIFGIVAGIIMGSLSTFLGKRKILTWPMLLLVSVGCLGALYATGGLVITLFCGIIGFGVTGYMTAYTTIPAELPNSNPQFYTGAVVLIYGISFIITYLIPYPFEAMLNAGYSIKFALTINVIPAFVGAVALMFLPETGPKAKRQKER